MEAFFSDRTYEMPRLDAERFCIGLLASLKLSGVDLVTTTGNDHVDRLAGVEEHLRQHRAASAYPDATLRMPDQITSDEYQNSFNQALLDLEDIGAVEHLGPYFLHLEVTLTEEWTRDILGRFRPEEQQLFLELAQIYAKSE